MIITRNKRYVLPGSGNIPFADDPALRILCRDIEQVTIPDGVHPGADSARTLAKKAMVQRSQDFAASSNTYLLACRMQWDALELAEPGAQLEDLRWYMASYASSIAGKLSQVNRDYAGARPYYLAFFALVQDDDPLWGRMRGLINPMLAYYWSNTGRELDINVSAWNLSMSSPASNPDPQPVVNLSAAWQLAVGKYHACEMITNNTPATDDDIQCWGLNKDGQLGDGTYINSPIPVFVK